MGFYEDVIEGFSRIIREEYESKPGRFAKALDVRVNQITRMLKRERAPQIDTVGPWLDFVGAKIHFPGSKTAARPFQELDPLTARAHEIIKTLRESGVAELEILRAVRSMLDSEIDKAIRSGYRVKESSPPALVAEPKPEYNK